MKYALISFIFKFDSYIIWYHEEEQEMAMNVMRGQHISTTREVFVNTTLHEEFYL